MATSDLRAVLAQVGGSEFRLSGASLGLDAVTQLFETYLPAPTLTITAPTADTQALLVQGRTTLGEAQDVAVVVRFLLSSDGEQVDGIELALALTAWSLVAPPLQFQAEILGQLGFQGPTLILQASRAPGPRALISASYPIRASAGTKTAALSAEIFPHNSAAGSGARTNLVFIADLVDVALTGADELAQFASGGSFDLFPPELPLAPMLDLRRLTFVIDPVAGTLDILRIELISALGRELIPKALTIQAFTITVVVIAPATLAAVYASVGATLDIYGLLVEVGLLLPDLFLEGEVSHETPIVLKPFAAHFTATELIPDSFRMTALQVGVGLSAPHAYGFAITLADLWRIPFGSQSLDLTSLSFGMTGSTNETPGVTISGRVDFAGAALYLTATHPPGAGGWSFAGGTLDTSPILIGSLLAELMRHFDLPAGITLPTTITELQITRLAISWDTASGAFSLSGQASDPWPLELGPRAESFLATLAIQSMIDPASGGRTSTGSFSGELNLDGTVFLLRYDLVPNEQILRGAWVSADKPLDHAALGDLFSTDLRLPEGIHGDLSLTQLSFTLDLSKQSGDSFVLEGDSARYGAAYFLLQRDVAQQWSGALLVALPEGKELHPSDLPLVGKELGVLDFLRVASAFFLVASRDIAALPLPKLGGMTLAPVRVARGLQLGAVVDLTGEGSHAAERQNLRGLIGRESLLMQISVGGDVVLVAELEDEVVFRAGSKQIRLMAPALIVKAVPIEFTLRGAIQIRLKDDLIDAAGFVTIGAEEATCAFAIASEHGSLPFPMGLPGIHLAELGVAMGMVFEPPQLELGLQGNFFIGEPPPGLRPAPALRAPGAMPDDNQFVMILGMVDIIPNPLLLSMYLAKVDLATIIAAFTDRAPHLPEVLTKISASELLLYWCDEPIQQPNGTWVNPGFGFTASLDIWGFPAHADLAIDLANRQISGNASIAPIEIAGVIELRGTGEGTPTGFTGSQLIPAHGAYVHVNTAASPYLLASAELTLFNSFHQEVQAQVRRDGFDFEVAYRVGEIFKSSLSCILEGHKHFGMGFEMELQLEIGPVTVAGIHLGRIRLGETGFHALLDAQLTNELDLTVEGGFSYDGHQLNLPSVHLKETPQSLEHLPQLIRAEIVAAEKEIFTAVYDEAEQIVGAVTSEAEALWSDWEAEEQRMLGELKRDLEAAEAAIVREVGQIERDGEAAARAIRHEADLIIADVHKGLAELDRAMDVAEREIHRLAQEAAAEAERVAQAAAHDLAVAAHTVAQAVSEAANTVKSWVKEAARDVKHFFKHIF